MDPRATDALLDDAAAGAAEAEAVLAGYGLADPKRAHRNVLAMAADPSAAAALRSLLPELLEALARCADADLALNSFERYAARVASRGAFFARLAADPALIELLAAVFSTGELLSDTLVRNPEYL